ncbi:MAG: VIT1/CCC1 transporter family protein [Simkaniaceae bacterium]
MKKDPLEELKKSHTKNAIRERLAKEPKHYYLKDFIYGAIDGTVTTFAVVAGVAGAELSTAVIIILGICNLIADGFSMGVSNFLGSRAEKEMRQRALQEELRHIKIIPEGEKEEIRQIFAAKGFSGKDLEHIVDVVTSDVKLWLNTMMQEELDLPKHVPSPILAAGFTFFAFLLIGFLPLGAFILSYLMPAWDFQPFFWSMIITGFAFFIVGAFKSAFVGKKWFRSGLETLFIGGTAAALAYWIGALLKGITH